MAYTPHTWTDGELITAEKLNDLEGGAAQAAQPGPKGEKGDPGEGLTGSTAVLEKLATEADAATVLGKVNEIIDILNARGVTAHLKRSFKWTVRFFLIRMSLVNFITLAEKKY